ncbi:MAG TPA: alkaline phosphatase family protein [Planctomycetota bacterium]|nr:alkaline phosphatase family protein [Planctomycetota bacterium]
MPKPEVLLIGIDGATFNLIDPWVDLGYLPVLGGMLRHGVRGTLSSTHTPNAMPAWKAVTTGKNPGKLGVFNWKNKTYGSYEAKTVDPETVGGRDIWQIIGDAGKTVAVVGVPFTWQPQPVNGALLTGMLTPPNSDFAYPPELATEILRELGEYRIDPQVLSVPAEEALLEEQMANINNRFHVVRHLLQKNKYDFVMVVFTAPDRIQHWFWPPTKAQKGTTLQAYQQIDWAIAQMRGLIDPDTTIMVVSDHGFMDLERIFHVNQLFANLGWLVIEERGIGWAEQLGVTKGRIKEFVQRLTNEQVGASLPDSEKQLLTLGAFGLDMSRTRAWAWSGGEVFINLRDREPHGIVAPEEYNAFRKQIIDTIESVQDNGRRLNVRVFTREEIYSGPLLEHAPDLMIELREPGYAMANHVTGTQPVEILPGRLFSVNGGSGGTHTMDAIFTAAGPLMEPRLVLQNASIIDAAPTVLHLMGLPVPADMDGKVMPIFARGSPPAERQVRVSDVEEKLFEPESPESKQREMAR